MRCFTFSVKFCVLRVVCVCVQRSASICSLNHLSSCLCQQLHEEIDEEKIKMDCKGNSNNNVPTEEISLILVRHTLSATTSPLLLPHTFTVQLYHSSACCIGFGFEFRILFAFRMEFIRLWLCLLSFANKRETRNRILSRRHFLPSLSKGSK